MRCKMFLLCRCADRGSIEKQYQKNSALFLEIFQLYQSVFLFILLNTLDDEVFNLGIE